MAVESPQSSDVTVRFKNQHRDFTLETGTYLLGRHRSCDIVLDSPHVSRRHARVYVGRNGVQVADVASANGVYVNGERVGTDPVRVADGDRLMLGEEELQVLVSRPSRPVSDKLPISKPAWFIRASDDEDEVPEPERSSPGTRSANFFELVGKIVDRALAEGRVADAHTMLQPQLNRVLLDARAGRTLDDTARDGALRYALLLANSPGQTRALDYTLDLLTALAMVPSPLFASELARALETSDSVDDARLASYVAIVEARNDARLAHWARGLRGLVAKKSSR
jgi:pSer/pThr/pTyr-binding forkhead associated (FHA) protein